jgi:SAM-dependent methyltransferase
VAVALNPAGQYADDRNLRARQRFWEHQRPSFDDVGWVLGLAGLSPGQRVLDAGCGNGVYLRGLAAWPVRSAGCDLSLGMLRPVAHRPLLAADVAALPVRDAAFDVVLAVHMLYHVSDRAAAVAENAAAQLSAAFTSISCHRPARQPPVVIQDATIGRLRGQLLPGPGQPSLGGGGGRSTPARAGRHRPRRRLPHLWRPRRLRLPLTRPVSSRRRQFTARWGGSHG